MADFSITREQYDGVLESLGLDPDTTTSVNLTGVWFSVAVADVDDDGHPRLEQGQLVLKHLSGPIQDAEPDA